MNKKQAELNKEEKTFKKAMGQAYIQDMANHRRKQLEDKLRNINEDNIKIKQLERMQEEERYKTSLSKLSLKNDQSAVLKLREEQKKDQIMVKEQERNEYNRMLQDNIDKEINKEQEYRSYYNKYENKHKNRVKNHQDFLKQNSNRRSNEQDLYENRYCEEKTQLNDAIYRNTMLKQNDSTRKNFDIVKQQLERKQMERARDAELQRKAIEQRFKEDEFNKKLSQMEREENMRNKLLYQD